MRINVFFSTYTAYGVFREFLVSVLQPYAIQPYYQIMSFLPSPILNIIIFCWILSKLSFIIEELQRRSDQEQVVLFQRARVILLVALPLATLPMLFEGFVLLQRHCSMSASADHSRCVQIGWRTQWFLADGCQHIIFLLALGSMMHLWSPLKGGKRFMYSPDLDTEETAETQPSNTAVWRDEDDPEEGGDSPNGRKHNVVAPDTIGAGSRQHIQIE